MVRNSLLLPLLALAAAGDARPAGYPVGTATIEWPHRSERRLIVGQHVWACRGAVCSGAVAADTDGSLARACRSIGRRGVRVLSFETANRRLDEAQLARCNGGGR
jgi:hypothetical protein